jgi:hypothetical protein
MTPYACRQIAGVGAPTDLETRLGEHLTCGVDSERVVDRPRELVDRREIAQFHDRHDTRRRTAAGVA